MFIAHGLKDPGLLMGICRENMNINQHSLVFLWLNKELKR